MHLIHSMNGFRLFHSKDQSGVGQALSQLASVQLERERKRLVGCFVSRCVAGQWLRMLIYLTISPTDQTPVLFAGRYCMCCRTAIRAGNGGLSFVIAQGLTRLLDLYTCPFNVIKYVI